MADGNVSDRLVIEHIEPMNRLLTWLMDSDRDAGAVVTELRRSLEVVIVTTEESRRLPDAGTPQERYTAAGLDLQHFRPLDEWIKQ